MPSHRRRFLSAAAAAAGAALLALPRLALPQALGADERRAVRETIEGQLLALAAGDAVRAFSYASPTIRRQFGDAETFIGMVRQGYAMVIRPASKSFFEPERAERLVLQVVQLQDAAGQRWLATYQLVQLIDQTGRPWRINGVVVTADTGKSST